MSKKKKKYRPKPVMLNSWERVIQGVQPISRNFNGNLITLKLKAFEALDTMKRGEAAWHEINVLVECFNISEAYARHGHGSDWSDEIRLAQEAVEALTQRAKKLGKVVLTGPEMSAIALALEIHSEQLDNSTVRMLEEMIDYVIKEKAAGRAEKLPSIAFA